MEEFEGLNREQIIMALELCAGEKPRCHICPYYEIGCGCNSVMMTDAVKLLRKDAILEKFESIYEGIMEEINKNKNMALEYLCDARKGP